MDKILTVIIPSYNMEAYLPKCLGSLVVSPELMDRLEVLVVNDGSKDRTSEIAHEFEKKYPQTFKVIDKENGNYGSCVNVGLYRATGKYIKILDADDSFDKRGFEAYLGMLENLTGDVDLIISDYEVVDENDSVEERRSYEELRSEIPFSLKRFISCRKYCTMHAFTYRIALLRDMKYEQLEGVSYTDSEWIWLPLVYVNKIFYFNEVVYRYLRGREGQTMDPIVRAKNVWMQLKILIHAIKQIDKMEGCASYESKKHVETVALQKLRDVYQSHCFNIGEFSTVDLREFDMKLNAASKKFYDLLGETRYSRRLPYRFVKAWRNRAISFSFMKQVCKLYSMIVSR